MQAISANKCSDPKGSRLRFNDATELTLIKRKILHSVHNHDIFNLDLTCSAEYYGEPEWAIIGARVFVSRRRFHRWSEIISTHTQNINPLFHNLHFFFCILLKEICER